MAYSTQNDMLEQVDEDVLIQLTDDDDAGTVDANKVTAAIAGADALIDGYCGKKYSVPFSTVPALVARFSVDIAVYNLYGRRKGAPEDIRTRFKDAVDFLKGVASGSNSLGEDDPEGVDSSAPQMATTNPARIFDRDKMSGF
jgi:phage gp36-like protein